MLVQDIKAELDRLQVHPVNLDVSLADDGNVSLRGSLLAFWKVPQIIDAEWFLEVLKDLPDAAGPKAVMDGYSAAYDRMLHARGSRDKSSA